MYFHGTPSSRLDLCFGEQLAAECGVRLVSFDRPGYGGSTPAPFGLASIAADAHAVADELGIAGFATLGQSGGGPGALAAAAVPGGRVTRVGIASGPGPFQRVPGALGQLDDNDRTAVALLPGDPAGAAAAFAAGTEPLAGLIRAADDAGIVSAFQELLSPRDNELMRDPRLAAAFAETMREGLRPGTSGAGWATSPGSGNGTSTWAPSPARSCCGTAARTAWRRPRMGCGCRRTWPGHDSSCVTARAISGSLSISTRCSTL